MVKKIGKYELGKTIGAGNFSKVKLGTEVESRKTWAIKIINKERLARERLQDQLMREIAVMKRMDHPYVIKMHEAMQTSNHIYIVLELVSGGELFDKIVASRRFDESTARYYFQQLLQGLSHSHSLGIAHRDIKPENLLLDSHNCLKISDFGLSNLQPNSGVLLQTVCGTPNYVAPEVLKERGYNGFMADVWSCGVVLFTMLAGHLPFDDQDLNNLFSKIERAEYRMPRSFSDGASNLISRMLTVDPAARITIQGIMDHPWFLVNYTPLSAAKVVVSDEEVANAITDAEAPARPSQEPTPTAAPGVPTSAGGCDAFDLISRLTSGALNPLITSQPAMIKSWARFLFAGTVSNVHDSLVGLKANPKMKEGSNEIKGFIQARRGLLTYMVSFIPTCSALSFVEFRRGRGDALDFNSLFADVRQALGSNVRSAILEPGNVHSAAGE